MRRSDPPQFGGTARRSVSPALYSSSRWPRKLGVTSDVECVQAWKVDQIAARSGVEDGPWFKRRFSMRIVSLSLCWLDQHWTQCAGQSATPVYSRPLRGSQPKHVSHAAMASSPSRYSSKANCRCCRWPSRDSGKWSCAAARHRREIGASAAPATLDDDTGLVIGVVGPAQPHLGP